MCGISGFINFSKTFSKEELSLYASVMSDSMFHRGPNSYGIWVDEKEGVSFSHRRLSILDLSNNGHQPMESSCGRYLIVYNGEIYNFRELRERIEKSKVKFKSSTDTEVIIELVSKFGVLKTSKLYEKENTTRNTLRRLWYPIMASIKEGVTKTVCAPF